MYRGNKIEKVSYKNIEYMTGGFAIGSAPSGHEKLVWKGIMI